MKKLFGLCCLIVLMGGSGCIVAPPGPPAGVAVGVYGEYPRTYHGYGASYGYYRWHHPYDRDRYFYRY